MIECTWNVTRDITSGNLSFGASSNLRADPWKEALGPISSNSLSALSKALLVGLKLALYP